MKKEYMLKRLVSLYDRLGVEVSINSFGVVRTHHPRIKDDCFYPSITSFYKETFGQHDVDPSINGSSFFTCYADGKIDIDFSF